MTRMPDNAGQGHGHWHGPHESPSAMTVPLMALALGAIVAGFVGIPAALGGGNTIERFLEPSFTAQAVVAQDFSPAGAAAAPAGPGSGAAPEGETESGASRGLELGLMAFSVLIAAIGIGAAWTFYVTKPELSGQWAERFAGAHRLLSHKYYVDELYDATVIAATWQCARSLWTARSKRRRRGR